VEPLHWSYSITKPTIEPSATCDAAREAN